MDTPDELLRKTAQHIELLFDPDLPDRNEILNYSSTLRLVQNCSLLCAGNDLQKQDSLIILLAAWFEYTGLLNKKENFQELSAENASYYFTERGLNNETIEEIRTLILSTRHPQQPLGIREQILCDACNAWMAKMNDEADMTEKDSINLRIQRLENHIYFTAFARKIFDKPKEKNLSILKEKMKERSTDNFSSVDKNPHSKNDSNLPSTLDDYFKPERGVETLFRNTSSNQMHLIRLADYKASLVISINSIIISVVISLLIVQLKTNKYLELPTLIMMLTNLITILIAVSATRPKMRFIPRNSAYGEIADNNLLYHGNFSKISLDQFKKKIKETIISKDQLYNSLITDIYHQGNILNLKFKRINVAYSVFVAGLLLSIISFVISFLLYGQAK